MGDGKGGEGLRDMAWFALALCGVGGYLEEEDVLHGRHDLRDRGRGVVERARQNAAGLRVHRPVLHVDVQQLAQLVHRVDRPDVLPQRLSLFGFSVWYGGVGGSVGVFVVFGGGAGRILCVYVHPTISTHTNISFRTLSKIRAMGLQMG